MITASHNLKTNRIEMIFKKKKAVVKGKNLGAENGVLTSLADEELGWKVALGHDATAK